MSGQHSEIDFVVTWVDGGDPAWLAQRAQYDPAGADVRAERYRDWELLRYWFRGIEQYAPWVRKVHFVTWGHLPPWLNTDHPKLHIVRHEDYIPADALPTFNSNSLEVYLHRIPGLAEQFVYFNDDLLFLRSVSPEDFFRGGLPRDMLALQPVVANPDNPVMSRILLNDSLVICRHFDKRETMRRHPGKYFRIGYPPLYFFYNLLEIVFPLYTGFYTVHGPAPMLRSCYEEIWEKEPEVLCATGHSRFRSGDNVTQYLFREWQKQKGEFIPANLHRDFAYLDVAKTDDCCAFIRARKRKMVCVNDTSKPIDFPVAKEKILAAVDAVLPTASGFEVDA